MALNTGWTEKESQILKKMWEDGQSASKCGSILKRSRNAVVSKVHRMGLKNHGSNIQRTPRKKVLKSTKNKTEVIKDHFKVGDKTPVSLDELTVSSCRWPLEDENGKHIGYCGCNKGGGLAYCDEHAKIAYPVLRQLKQDEEAVA